MRMGSTRVPFKNLRLIGGRPLYEWLTETALKSDLINELFINSDSELALSFARQKFCGSARYHLRPSHLGTSAAKLDDFAYEFMECHDSDYTMFLNPCNLFLSSETIDRAIQYVVSQELDSCVASREEQTHAFTENKPVNFSFSTPMPRSQDLSSIHLMTSGFFIWRTEGFLNHYKRLGYASFYGKFHSYPVSSREAIDIDTEKDFSFAEHLILSDRPDSPPPPKTPQYVAGLSELIEARQIQPN